MRPRSSLRQLVPYRPYGAAESLRAESSFELWQLVLLCMKIVPDLRLSSFSVLLVVGLLRCFDSFERASLRWMDPYTETVGILYATYLV